LTTIIFFIFLDIKRKFLAILAEGKKYICVWDGVSHENLLTRKFFSTGIFSCYLSDYSRLRTFLPSTFSEGNEENIRKN